MSWQRLYRPKTIKGLHLTNVRETLQQFMEKGHIPQVLLFAGPKGTGKTSSARILGAMLNDPQNAKIVDYQFFKGSKPQKKQYFEPDASSQYNDKIYRGQSFVVQEMDAASNRGIDDVRELKERVALPPQDGKMTVYILDEAHMLTTAAFNALLKLLEEPPPHAVFILATTELHKIPETIKSRCSIIHFRRADHQELKQTLKEVLEQEKIKFQEEALDLICEKAEGSFRDAVKMLEMVAVDGQVNLTQVENILSSSVNAEIAALLTFTLEKNQKAIVETFEDLRARNIDEQFFFKSFLNYLHLCLLQNLGVKTGKPFTSQKIALFLLKELAGIELVSAPIEHLSLELKLLDLVSRAKDNADNNSKEKKRDAGSGNNNQGRVIKKKSSQKQELQEVIQQEVSAIKIKLADKDEVMKTDSTHAGDSQKLIQNWPELLTAVKQHNITLEALLRSAKPIKGVNGTAWVQVFYKFHKEQLEQPKFKALISECAAPIAGGEIKIEYKLSKIPRVAELQEVEKEVDLATLAEEVLI